MYSGTPLFQHPEMRTPLYKWNFIPTPEMRTTSVTQWNSLFQPPEMRTPLYTVEPLFQPPEMRTPLYTVELLYSNP